MDSTQDRHYQATQAKMRSAIERVRNDPNAGNGFIVPRSGPRGGNRERNATEPPKAVPDLMAFSDMQTPPEPEWLVDGMLRKGGLSLLTGRPKAGKSTLARCLITAITKGQRFFGREVRGGPVVYFPMEESPNSVNEHLTGINADLRMIFGADWQQGPSIPPGTDLQHRLDYVEAQAKTIQPVAVIFDPLQYLVRIKDLNDYASVSLTLQPLVQFARQNECHVMLVHHERKEAGEAGTQVLGSTAVYGSVDVLLSVQRVMGGKDRVLEAYGRDGVDIPRTFLRMTPSGWVDAGNTVDEAAAKALEGRIIETLTDHGEPMKATTLKAAVKGRAQAVTDALNDLVIAGRVLVTYGKGKGKPKLFSLASTSTPERKAP